MWPLLLALPSAAAFVGGVFQPPAPLGGTSWSSTAAAAAGVPAIGTPPTAVGLDLSSLFSTTLRWGISTMADPDDMMLAMVSPHAYWLLREWRTQAFGSQEAARDMLTAARQQLLNCGRTEVDALRGATVSLRTKGLFSTFHKAVVRQQQVHDVLALRVVLRKGLGPDACFAAHDAIRGLWATEAGRQKDYVSEPKLNGYQALHDTMVLPTGQPFEVQIRTDAMHRKAEYGTAAHRRYKGALYRLPMAIMTGVARRPRWPLHPEAALGLATKLSV